MIPGGVHSLSFHLDYQDTTRLEEKSGVWYKRCGSRSPLSQGIWVSLVHQSREERVKSGLGVFSLHPPLGVRSCCLPRWKGKSGVRIERDPSPIGSECQVLRWGGERSTSLRIRVMATVG